MRRITSGFLVTIALSSTARAEEPIHGTWKRGDGKAIVEIAPCGGALCAVNTWVAPTAKDEKAGDKLVMRLKRQDTARYKGTAHDPQRGLTYSMTVNTSETSMQSQGCVLAGLACRSMGWTRLR